MVGEMTTQNQRHKNAIPEEVKSGSNAIFVPEQDEPKLLPTW
jgi:hypothetical protein